MINNNIIIDNIYFLSIQQSSSSTSSHDTVCGKNIVLIVTIVTRTKTQHTNPTIKRESQPHEEIATLQYVCN